MNFKHILISIFLIIILIITFFYSWSKTESLSGNEWSVLGLFVTSLLTCIPFIEKILKKYLESEPNEEFLKDSLKVEIAEICESELRPIKKSEIGYIESLTWIRYQRNMYFQMPKGDKRPSFKRVEFEGSLLADLKINKKTIKKIFILGDVGSGKTTALFSCIEWLLNNHTKVPIYLSLSTWKSESSLEEWMINEMCMPRYTIGKKEAKFLIKNNLIIPCLDGLDEAEYKHRQSCVNAINKYANNNDIIFTCRSDEHYQLVTTFSNPQSSILVGFTAYVIQPWNKDTINNILSKLNKDEDIFHAIEKNEEIIDVIKTPLQLNIFVKVFKGLDKNKKENIIHSKDSNLILDMLWSEYVPLMFAEKGKINTARNIFINILFYNKSHKSFPEKIIIWLSYLAKYLGDKKYFFVEQLQPSILKEESGSYIYYILSRTICGILLAIASGWFMSSPYEFIAGGVIGGFTIALVSIRTIKDKHQHYNKRLYIYLRNIANIIFYGLSVAIPIGLYYGFTVPRKPEDMIGFFAWTEAFIGFFLSLFFGAFFGLRKSWQTKEKDISLIENPKINLIQSVIAGLHVSIFLGVVLGIGAWMVEYFAPNTSFGNWLLDTINSMNMHSFFIGLLLGFIFGFPIGLIMEWSSEREINELAKEKIKNISPNYGIKETIKNAFVKGILFTIFLCLFFGVFFWLYTHDLDSLEKSILNSIGGGSLVILWFGGIDYVQHWTLRLTLWIQGKGPLNYIDFLKEAEHLGFIKRSGASYKFYHGSLQKYFIKNIKLSLEESASLEIKASNRILSLNNLNWVKVIILCFTLLILLIPIICGFYQRYITSVYWNNYEKISYIRTEKKNGIVDISSNQFYFTDSIKLSITMKDKFKAGNFTGYIGPEGTEAGFLGIPIGDTYDRWPKFPHGALLYKLSNDTTWYACAKKERFTLFPKEFTLNMKVNKGDTISFAINDLEYQNNSKSLKVYMMHCDTCFIKEK